MFCMFPSGDYLEEVKQQTGADVMFDVNPTPVPGMRNIIIRGSSSQIEQAIRSINFKTWNLVCKIIC